jgi:hypothetical protein
MAQQFPATAQLLYETLSSDTVFMSLLGTYTFKAGEELPAISVISAGEDLPSLRNVKGVECIIQDAGNFTSSEYLTGDAPRLTIEWSVFLVAWNPAKGADLQLCAQRACSRFLGSQAIQTVGTTDGLGSLVQTKLIIRSDMPIVAA